MPTTSHDGLPPPERDLADVIGALSAEEAAEMVEEVRRQRQIDPELWR